MALMFSQLLLVHTLLFGVGFWLVGADPTRRRVIVRLGVPAQLAFGSLLLVHCLLGMITRLLLVPGVVDLILRSYFAIDLWRTPGD